MYFRLFFYDDVVIFWFWLFYFYRNIFYLWNYLRFLASEILVSKSFKKFSSSLVIVLFTNKSPKISVTFALSSILTLGCGKSAAASKTPSIFTFLLQLQILCQLYLVQLLFLENLHYFLKNHILFLLDFQDMKIIIVSFFSK